MMSSKAIQFLEANQSETPSRFVEEANWRKENAGWLRWSRQLATTLIGYMQDNGLKRADLADRLGISPQYVSRLFLAQRTSVSKVLPTLKRNWAFPAWKFPLDKDQR